MNYQRQAVYSLFLILSYGFNLFAEYPFTDLKGTYSIIKPEHK